MPNQSSLRRSPPPHLTLGCSTYSLGQELRHVEAQGHVLVMRVTKEEYALAKGEYNGSSLAAGIRLQKWHLCLLTP
jgi:hypothetical protein